MYTLYLSQGTLTTGEPYYAYVALHSRDVPSLQAAEKYGNFRLGDYGEVVAGEIGVAEPPFAVSMQVAQLVASWGDEEENAG